MITEERIPFKITSALAKKLIAEQFPLFSHFGIKKVDFQGHDNRTFRLGDDMVIRLPSAEPYALQVLKEQKWLPYLATHLSLSIPQPIALGKPSHNYTHLE